MSKWIRNRKHTNGRPNSINGKRVEVRHRDGSVSKCVADDFDESWNTSDNSPSDIMAYRICEPYMTPYQKLCAEHGVAKDSEWEVIESNGFVYKGDIVTLRNDNGSDCPWFNCFNGIDNLTISLALLKPRKDPAKIAPKLWAAYKDVLNDEALNALLDVICEQWPNLHHALCDVEKGSAEDCSDILYAFLWKETTQGHDFWYDVSEGKYNKPTTALEMQDTEVGIHEPVNEIIYGTDNPPVVKHHASINPDGTIDVVLPVNSESPSLGYTCAFKEEDMVNRPPHYTHGGIECIDAIKAALTTEEFAGYCKGNALKYIWREKHKGGKESLQKAIWYLEKIAK